MTKCEFYNNSPDAEQTYTATGRNSIMYSGVRLSKEESVISTICCRCANWHPLSAVVCVWARAEFQPREPDTFPFSGLGFVEWRTSHCDGWAGKQLRINKLLFFDHAYFRKWMASQSVRVLLGLCTLGWLMIERLIFDLWSLTFDFRYGLRWTQRSGLSRAWVDIWRWRR